MDCSPNAALIRKACETLIAGRKLDLIGDYFSPHYAVHHGARHAATGHAPIRHALSLMHAAFPIIRVKVRILAEQADRISWMRTMEGVQSGRYLGFPASGRRIIWREMVTSRIRDNTIVEEWLVSDLAECLLRARKR